jgi:hypothetical protein
MNNLVKNAIIFSAGAAIGAVTAVFVVKKKYEAIAEQEIESMREYKCKKKRPEESVNDTEEDPEPRTAEKKATIKREQKEYQKMVREYKDAEEESAATQYNEYEQLSASANRPNYPDPYVISLEQFSEENDHYDKINLYYYAGDDTLCDVDEEIVDDLLRTVGEDSLDSFDEHNTVYVRNERLQIDYEIILCGGKYNEIVLGNVED